MLQLPFSILENVESAIFRYRAQVEALMMCLSLNSLIRDAMIALISIDDDL
jgi:hypothetical protein